MMKTRDASAIRERAYQLWEARGRRQGHAAEDWLDAERQIMAEEPLVDPLQMQNNGPAQPQPEVRAKPKRTRSRKAAPAGKTSIVPLDESTGTRRETPKIGSRDAPGG